MTTQPDPVTRAARIISRRAKLYRAHQRAMARNRRRHVTPSVSNELCIESRDLVRRLERAAAALND